MESKDSGDIEQEKAQVELEVEANEGKQNPKQKEKLRNVAAFYAFGALIYTVFSVIISGAQDILAGSFIPTAAVLVTNVGPYFLVTVFAPYFIHKVPYLVRIFFIYILFTVGLFMIVLAKEIYLKLVGICVTSLGAGLGEITFFTLTAFYEQVTVSAYSAGTGTGFILGPLYYTGMTTWSCISPTRTMLIMAGFPLLYIICYAILEKKKKRSTKKDVTMETNSNSVTKATDGDNLTKASNPDDATEPKDVTMETNKDGTLNVGEGKQTPLTWKEKFTTAGAICHFVIALFVAYVSEYLIIQAVITTMAFPSAPFPPRVHYQYYIFIFLSGEFIARSYLAVCSSIIPSLVSRLVIKRIWLLSVVLLVHLVFFLFVAWYRFIHSVWIVFVFIFTAGLCAGATFTNSFVVVSESTEPRYREFAMGFATIGMGAGTFTAGVIGLIAEPAIREHCIDVIPNAKYCFTRPLGRWNGTLEC